MVRLAFWNLYSLFAPGTSPGRGAADGPEHTARLDAFARAVPFLHKEDPCALLALCELDAPSCEGLAERLGVPPALALFRDKPGEPSGLAVLGLRDPVATLSVEPGGEWSHGAGRLHQMVVRVGLRFRPEPLRLAVCHWKSGLGDPRASRDVRRDGAEWLAERLGRSPEPLLILGDLNVEPWDELLRGPLSTRRARRSLHLRRDLYNPLWSRLGDDSDPAEPQTEPHHTWRGRSGEGRTLDHVLFPESLARVGRLAPCDYEGLIRAGVAARDASGRIVANRDGGSDHLPLALTLDV